MPVIRQFPVTSVIYDFEVLWLAGTQEVEDLRLKPIMRVIGGNQPLCHLIPIQVGEDRRQFRYLYRNGKIGILVLPRQEDNIYLGVP